MADLDKQLRDYRLTTAQIFYHMPDYESILQEYLWQDYDLAPKFPVLNDFVSFWIKEIEGKLHSIYVAERKLICADGVLMADHEFTVQ